MDIRQLNQLFQQGAYQDYPLAEYQFLRRFCELTQPRTMACVGGHTNLDVFYSLQECDTRVTNWDPGEPHAYFGWMGWTRQGLAESHQRFKTLTGFRNEYEWLAKSVKDLREVGQQDMIWLSAHQDGVYDLEQWPDSMVICHYGNMIMAQKLWHTHQHLPLVAIGRRIAVFSRQEHDWEHHTYMTTRNRDFMDLKDVREIKS